MRIITSKENRIYRMCRELLLKKHRSRAGMYLMEGETSVKEAAELHRVELIVCREDYSGEILFPDVETALMTGRLFREITRTETDQGILAVVRKTEPSREEFLRRAEEGNGNILIMDALQDPGNIGTMIRTALGAGYRGIIATKGTADIYSDKVVRAAAGALLKMPMLTGITGKAVIELLKKGNKRIIGTDPKGAVPYYRADLSRDCALVIGNEGGGMSEVFREHVQENVTIPMVGGLESLNAAVAAGILMYQSIEKGK